LVLRGPETREGGSSHYYQWISRDDSRRIERRHLPCFVNCFEKLTVAVSLLTIIAALFMLEGCGTAQHFSAADVRPVTSALLIQPAVAYIQLGQNLQFSINGNVLLDQCTWQSSDPSVLNYLGNRKFMGTKVGTSQITATCGNQSGSASITVVSQEPAGPIEITSGGVYSGNWSSDDATVPAVIIQTDELVTIQNSTITGRGTLISANGVKSGANVTVQNVTGTALDPGVAGLQRGAFLIARQFASLIVKNCTMAGASSGIIALGSSPSTLKILNNLASNLEDRASDGEGGLLSSRPRLGHFIILNNIVALSGAEIGWNEVVQAIGMSSTEDVINIYESQGTQEHPILVHDNYMEGSSSPVVNDKNYTGTALITDGSSTAGANPTAFVRFDSNEIVATAGSGIGIAYGHDITATKNRVVSCGVTSSGTWYAWGASAIGIWNYYKAGDFFNNTISGTVGGMVGPGPNHTAIAYDSWAYPGDVGDRGNAIDGNDFTDPCLASGGLNLAAEDAERGFWAQKISTAGEVIGDN
jgi:hypothetical protein